MSREVWRRDRERWYYPGEDRPITVNNPFKPGSDEWHRHNLGVKPGQIGQITRMEQTEAGLIVEGEFYPWVDSGKIARGSLEVSVDSDGAVDRVRDCSNPECPEAGYCGGECARNF